MCQTKRREYTRWKPPASNEKRGAKWEGKPPDQKSLLRFAVSLLIRMFFFACACTSMCAVCMQDSTCCSSYTCRLVRTKQCRVVVRTSQPLFSCCHKGVDHWHAFVFLHLRVCNHQCQGSCMRMCPQAGHDRASKKKEEQRKSPRGRARKAHTRCHTSQMQARTPRSRQCTHFEGQEKRTNAVTHRISRHARQGLSSD